MALHNDFGQIGEETACRYLMHRGYRLLSRNWHCGHLEIDIVAEWFGEVVFVEVKARSTEEYMSALDAVDFEKKQNLVQAAKAYMSYFRLDQPYRFDIITDVGHAPDYDVKQTINAFTPEGVAEERMRRKLHLE